MRKVLLGGLTLSGLLVGCQSVSTTPAPRLDMTGEWLVTLNLQIPGNSVTLEGITLNAKTTDTPKRGDFQMEMPIFPPLGKSMIGNTIDGTLQLTDSQYGDVLCKGTYTKDSFTPSTCNVTKPSEKLPAGYSVTLALKRA